jgi:hypothetical protein
MNKTKIIIIIILKINLHLEACKWKYTCLHASLKSYLVPIR